MRTSQIVEAYIRLLESENRIREQQLQLAIAGQHEAAAGRRFAELLIQREMRRAPQTLTSRTTNSGDPSSRLPMSSVSVEFAPLGGSAFESFADFVRRINNVGSEEHEQALTSEEIDRATTGLRWEESMAEDTPRCPVTLQQFVEGDQLLKINRCGHVFSDQGLRRVLEDSSICPLCRCNLRETSGEAPTTGVGQAFTS